MPGPNDTITMTKDGLFKAIPKDQAAIAAADGWTVPTAEASTERVVEQHKEETYGSVPGKIASTGAGVLRGFTGGLSDVALTGIYGDQGRRELNEMRERNAGLSMGGELIGAVASLGTSLPGGLAAKAGARIAKAGEGASALARIGRATAGGVVEGGLQGVGSGVSEVALSKEDLTFEHVASTIGSNALFGAGTGGVAGGAGKGFELGLGRTKKAIDEFAAKRAVAADVPADIAALDAKGLRAAEGVELEAIEAGRVPQRAQVGDEIRAHRQALKEEKVWLATNGATDRELKEIGKISFDADRQLDRLLNNPKALAAKPQRALDALQQQEHALERLEAFAAQAGDAPAIPKHADLAADDITATIRSKDLVDYGFQQQKGALDPVKLEKARKAIAEGQRDAIEIAVSPKGKLDVGDGRHRLAAALEADADITVRFTRGSKGLDSRAKGAADGVVKFGGEGRGGLGPTAREAVTKVPAALERNRALQARIGELVATPKTARLEAITAAREALQTGGRADKTLGQQMAQGAAYSGVAGVVGAIPFAGPFLAPLVGAKAAKLVEGGFGKLGKATSDAAARGAAAASAFLGKAEKVAGKVARIAPPVATKVLAGLRYAPPKPDEKPAPKKGAPKLHEVFTARASEVRSQTMYDATGRSVVRPEARMAIGAQLKGIGALNPILADKIETIRVRALETLANALPRRPDLPGVQLAGPDRWQHSDMEMRAWARLAAAVEDPVGALERATHGMTTPEDAKAMQEVFPEMLSDFVQKVLAAAPTLEKPLPYQRRLALSVLTGQPMDPAMDPRILKTLQSSFAAETGSEGGSQAPRAQPNFSTLGSVSKRAEQEQTPSQRRQA